MAMRYTTQFAKEHFTVFYMQNQKSVFLIHNFPVKPEERKKKKDAEKENAATVIFEKPRNF